jgi:hypothetical protein
MMRRSFALVVAVALLCVGCGGSDEEESAPPPTVPPRALSVEEWAGRIVNQLMRPTNRDIQTLTTLNRPETKIYIQQGNQDTIDVLNERMNDLAKCSDRLLLIGPPPAGETRIRQLTRLDGALHTACAHYTKVAETVLLAVKLLSSGREDVIIRGEQELRSVAADAAAATTAYDRAFQIALKIPEFRIHGVRPPA